VLILAQTEDNNWGPTEAELDRGRGSEVKVADTMNRLAYVIRLVSTKSSQI